MPNSRCIETGAREGVYLGSQLPVDAVPGKTGQNRAGPGVTLDRVFFNRIWWPEMELFSYFFETFFKTCIKGVRQWVVKSEAVFETCIKGVRQWEGKSDDFPCFPGRGKPAASKSRSLDTSTVPSNCMKGTAQMLVLLGKHDLHKVLVRSRTCANGFQRTLRGRSEPLRGRSEGAQRRAESLRGRPGAALVLVWLFPRVEESLGPDLQIRLQDCSFQRQLRVAKNL